MRASRIRVYNILGAKAARKRKKSNRAINAAPASQDEPNLAGGKGPL